MAATDEFSRGHQQTHPRETQQDTSEDPDRGALPSRPGAFEHRGEER